MRAQPVLKADLVRSASFPLRDHPECHPMPDPSALYAQALDACNRADWQRARNLASQLLPMSPDHAGLHYIAGVAGMELFQVPQALAHLERAVQLEPARANFAVQYAKALAMARLPALHAADQAAALAPDEPSQLLTLGMVYAQEKAHERAVPLLRLACEQLPMLGACRYALAMSLLFLGDVAAAGKELDTCLTVQPDLWKAYLSRSQLHRQTPTNNHVAQLEAVLRSPSSAGQQAKICLHTALAKEYEDLAEYPAAFAHYAQGKAAARIGRNYSIQRDEILFKSITDAFSERVAEPTGNPSREPIFVLGMPRSGTTLIERIISSHPDVHSAGELRNFPLALKRASGSRSPLLLDPDTLNNLGEIDWGQLGSDYLSSTRPHTGHTKHFIDKLPHNFLYIGAIAKALPQAKFICLRRNPMDTCLGNFRQLFEPNSPFHDYSYDLRDIGHYYLLFDQLMAHWRHVLQGRILEIDYERLVQSPVDASRELLQFCQLPWNDACLQFEKNTTASTTASAVQVRSPIYRYAIGRWQKFAPQLANLHTLLSDGGLKLDSPTVES